MIVTAAYGIAYAPSPGEIFFVGMPGDVWWSIALFQVVCGCWVAALVRADARKAARRHASLRAYFDTRLGMYSPR